MAKPSDGGNCRRRATLRGGKGLSEQGGAVRETGDNSILGNEVGRDDMQALGGSGLVETLLLGLGGDLVGEVLLGCASLLLLKHRQ